MWRTEMRRASATLTLALLAAAADAAQLTLGPARLGQNGWESPVLFTATGGEQVASMQFDIALPPGANAAAAQASGAALQAGKQAISSMIGPGQLRVVVAGLNQAALSNGEVATVSLGYESNEPPDWALYAPVLSTPLGERVFVESGAPAEEPDDNDAPGSPQPETPPPAEPEPDTTPEPEDDKTVDDPEDSTDGGTTGSRYLNGYPGGLGGGSVDGGFDDADTDKASKTATQQGSARMRPAAGVSANAPAGNAPAVRPGAVYEAQDNRGAAPRPAGQAAPNPRMQQRIERTGEAKVPGASINSTEAGALSPEEEERLQMASNSTGIPGAAAGLVEAAQGRTIPKPMFSDNPMPIFSKVFVVLLAVAPAAVIVYAYRNAGKRRKREPQQGMDNPDC